MKLAEKTGTITGYWFCEVTIQGGGGGVEGGGGGIMT